MRKARTFLAVVITFGVVGGALAYKAKRVDNLFYAETTITTLGPGHYTTICTVPTWIPYEVMPFGTSTVKVSISPTNSTCPVLSMNRVF